MRVAGEGNIQGVWATGERRTIPLSRRGHITGSVPVNSTSVHFESSLERDFIYLTTFEPCLLSIVSQPVTLVFVDDGRERRYTPDFLVRRPLCRPELTEIKYKADLEEQAEALVGAFAAARKWCGARGWTFAVRTEFDIRGTRLANAKRLFRFRDSIPCPDKGRRILDRLETPTRIGDLRLGPDLLPTLWALMARGLVVFPSDEPITPSTVLSLA